MMNHGNDSGDEQFQRWPHGPCCRIIIADVVRWPETLPTLVGAIAGSYIAARCAQRLDQRLIKGFVIVLGAGLTVYFFLRGV
jgi:uncharacterized membrane protein YfcA